MASGSTFRGRGYELLVTRLHRTSSFEIVCLRNEQRHCCAFNERVYLASALITRPFLSRATLRITRRLSCCARVSAFSTMKFITKSAKGSARKRNGARKRGSKINV